MSITVSFPSLFSERIGGVESVDLEGDTVEAILRALTERYTELASLVWKSLNLNPVLVVFLNGRQLKSGELDVKVRTGDEITILSALEGG
jgi:molybdopterin converting factor small subunit